MAMEIAIRVMATGTATIRMVTVERGTTIQATAAIIEATVTPTIRMVTVERGTTIQATAAIIEATVTPTIHMVTVRADITTAVVTAITTTETPTTARASRTASALKTSNHPTFSYFFEIQQKSSGNLQCIV